MHGHGFHGHHRHHWIFFVFLFIGGLALFGFGTLFLWNWLMPALFHLPSIDFWQAVGLMVLSRLLFGGFGHGHGFGRGFGHGGLHHKMRERWEIWEKLSPEEREKLIKERNSWGRGPWCGMHGEGMNTEQKSAESNDRHE